MEFKTIAMLKFEHSLLWNAMLNHMPEIGAGIDDLESIIEKERLAIDHNTLKVVNEWRAKPNLPAIVTKHIKPEMLSWTDTGMWDEKKKVVQWQISSHHFGKQMECEGSTLFEPAMGGKGTRISFSGNLQWKTDKISFGLGVLDSTVLKVADSVLGQLIPANFRKITAVLGNFVR
jgi:hypothetical protein